MNIWGFLVDLSKTEDGLYILKVGSGTYKTSDFEALKRKLLEVVDSIVNLLEGRINDGSEGS